MPGEVTSPTPAAGQPPAAKSVVHRSHAPLASHVLAPALVQDPFRVMDMLPYWGRSFGQQAIRDFGLDRQLSEVTNDETKFHVKLDVSQYKPEELEVTTKDNVVTVSGRHEERQDEHGYVSRSFVRRYVMPEGAQMDAMTSSLGKDGFLTLEAPKAALEGHRRIPIMQH